MEIERVNPRWRASLPGPVQARARAIADGFIVWIELSNAPLPHAIQNVARHHESPGPHPARSRSWRIRPAPGRRINRQSQRFYRARFWSMNDAGETLRRMVRGAGVEPTTFGSGGRRSIQLSYPRMVAARHI
jgi:hypothetical protein